MSRADGDTGERGNKQAASAGQVGGKALVLLQLDHIHTYRLDDAVAADGGTQCHNQGTKHHQPDGDLEIGDISLALGQKAAQQENPHEFLPILGAMHKGHSRAAGNLCALEKALGFAAVHAPADHFS